MKKQFKNFALIWLCGVILFSVVVLVVNILNPAVVLSTAFWAAYALVILAFAGQMLVAYKFFNEDSSDKVFLNMPLMVYSRRCVIVSAIIGTVLMIIPAIPFWVPPVIAVLILILFAVTIIKAKAAGDAVEAIGQKVAAQTEFCKEMTVKAQNIAARAKTEKCREAANKVYDAFRYSCKSSHGGLEDVEKRISANLTVFSDAVTAGDDELAASVGEQLIRLAEERDNLAKVNK